MPQVNDFSWFNLSLFFFLFFSSITFSFNSVYIDSSKTGSTFLNHFHFNFLV